MSWAKDEWKDGLTFNVLKHITEFEQQNERLVKDNKQKQFKLESSTASLEKQKRLTDEEKGKYVTLKRENQSLSETCQEAERNKQKLLHDIQLKDGKLSCVEGQLNRLKQSLDSETIRTTQLKNELEKEVHEHTLELKKNEKQTSELSKLQEHNNFQKRQIEGQIEKIKSLQTKLRQNGDFDTKSLSSRSSSQSSNDEYTCTSDSELQAKYEAEVQQRQKIEQEVVQLQQQLKMSSQELEKPLEVLSYIKQEMSTCDGQPPQLNQQLSEFKNCISKLELQLQSCKKELMSKTEMLNMKDVEFAEMRQSLEEKVKLCSNVSEDLKKTKSQLDQTNTQLEVLEKKSKQLSQELECQRHNSEAVIKGQEERLKEKDKQHREDLSSQSQALAALDKQYQELMSRMQHEQQSAQANQREMQGKLDKTIQETQKLNQQLTDAKLDDSNKEHAMKAKEQTIAELGQEIKSLKKDKNNMIADMDREATSRKKVEDQLNYAQNEIQRKENSAKNAEIKAAEQVAELEKMRKKALFDLENLRIVQTKLETENKELKKHLDAASNNSERKEQEVAQLKEKLEFCNKDIQRLNSMIQQLKMTISDNQENYARLERQFKEANQKSNAKENEVKSMAFKVDELENKCGSLIRELDNRNHEFDESKRKTSELHSKQENVQKMLDAKALEVDSMKKVASEFENLQMHQSLAKDGKLGELEKKLEEEQNKCAKLEGDINRVRGEFHEEQQAVEELRSKLQESGTIVKKHQEVTMRQEKEFEDKRKNFKNEMVALEEKIALIKKEKEQEKQEFAKTIHLKNDELFGSLDDLEKRSHEVVKLREAQVNLENVITAHELETNKMEENFKEQCEKTQKKEEELLARCEELGKEKALVSEKEKNLAIANDILKRDVKALQNDYRKACEVSDAKSAELKELIDKFDVSCKEVGHLRERVAHAEKSLEESEQRLKNSCEENSGLLQDLAGRDEQLESMRTNLERLTSNNQDESKKTEERNAALTEKLNLEIAEKNGKVLEVQNLALKITELQAALQSLETAFSTLNEKYENKDEVIRKKEFELQEMLTQMKDKESTLHELGKKLHETGNMTNDMQEKYRNLEQQNEEKSGLIGKKEQELAMFLTDLENLKKVSEEETVTLAQKVEAFQTEVSDLREKTANLEDALKAKDTEASTASASLASTENECQELRSMMDETAQMLIDLQEKNTDLEQKQEHLKTSLEVKNKELLEASEKLEGLGKNYQSFGEQHTTDLQKMNEEVCTLKQQLSLASELEESRAQEIKSLKDMIEHSEGEKNNLTEKLDKLQSSYDDVRGENSGLLQKIQHLSEVINSKNIELTSKKETLEGLENNFDSATRESSTEVSELREKVSALTTQIEHTEELMKIKEKLCEELSSKYGVLEHECEVLRAELQEKTSMLNSIEEQLAVIATKNEVLSSLLGNKEQEICLHSEEMQKSRSELQDDFQKNRDQLNTTNEELSNALSAKERLSHMLEAKEKEVARLTQLHEQTVKEKEEIRQQLNAVEDKLNVKSEELTSLAEQKVHIESLVANLNAEKDLLSQERNLIRVSTEEQVALLMLKVQEIDEKLTLSATEKDKLEDRVNHRESELQKSNERCMQFQKDMESLAAQKEMLQMDFEDKNDVIESMQKQIDQHEQLVTEMNAKVLKKDENCNGVAKDMEALRSQLDVTQMDVEDKETLIEQLNIKAIAMESQVQSLGEFKTALEEKLQETQAVVEQTANSLDEKTQELENLKEKSGLNQEQSGELVENFKKTVHQLQNEKRDLECRIGESEELVGSLEKDVTILRERVDYLSSENQELESTFSSTVESSKLCKLSLEKQIAELESQLQITAEAMQRKQDELSELQTSVATERSNLFCSNQELIAKKESLENEMKDILEKLQETEATLSSSKDSLTQALDEKNLSESMLVAVDGNLQTFKHLVIERERRIKELEALAGEKQDEVLKLKDISTKQGEELGKVREGMATNNQGKDQEVQEMRVLLSNLEESRKLEIATLNEDYKTQIEDLQKRKKIAFENAEQYKASLSELGDTLSTRNQEIVELNQRVESLRTELESKGWETESARQESEKVKSIQEQLLRDLNSEIGRLKSEILSGEEKLKRMEEKVVNIDMDSEKKHEENVVELSSLRHENEALKSQVGSLLTNLETVESDLQKRNERVEELENVLQDNEDTSRAECSRLHDRLKEVEEDKAEIIRKSHEENEQLTNDYRRKENELSNALNYEQEKHRNLNEEMDRLRDKMACLLQSNEDVTRVEQGQRVELSSQLADTKQQLSLSCGRLEELLAEKRDQYDAMQLAEREARQARTELEREVTDGKQSVRRLTDDTDEYKLKLEMINTEKNTLEMKLKEMQSHSLSVENNLKDFDLKCQDRITEMSSALGSTEAELRKVIHEKDELSSMLDHARTELEQALESLARVESEKDYTQVMDKQIGDLNGTIEVLHDQVTTLEIAKAELQSQLLDEHNAVSSLTGQVVALEHDIESKSSQHQVEATQLTQNLQVLEKQNSELSEKHLKMVEFKDEELRVNQQRFEAAVTEKDSMSAKLEEKASYTKQIEESNDEILEVNEKLCQKMERLEELLEQKKSEIAGHRGERRSVNQDYEDALHELETLRQESTEAIDKREEKITSLTHRVEDIQQTLEELAGEKKRLVDEKEDILDQIRAANQSKEEASNEADRSRTEAQDLRVVVEAKTSTITELTTATNDLQQAVDTKQRELEELKSFFDSANEDLDSLCEQRAEEIVQLKRELSTRSVEVDELEVKFNEKCENVEDLSRRLHEITEQLETLSEQHQRCADYKLRTEDVQTQLQQAEHSLELEKSNAEALLKDFEEKERRWEEESEQIRHSVLKTDQDREIEVNLKSEVSRVEDEMKQLTSSLQLKEEELKAAQLLCAQKTSDVVEVETRLKSEIKALEQSCEELKYSVKQKDEELFVLKEKLNDRESQVDSFEKKAACAKEIELELRHHLGEVTQEFEKLRESGLDESTGNSELERLRAELQDALQQVCDSKEEVAAKESEFEQEKTQIVESAKDFAVKREEEFEANLATKEEQLCSVENELNQLKHELQIAQESQRALLEAADEREREFEATRTQLHDGSLNQGKFTELSVQLRSERHRVLQLEENCKKLQDVIEQGKATITSLQKRLDSFQKTRATDEARLDSEVTSLNQEVKALDAELKKARESLGKEQQRVEELSAVNQHLTQSLTEYEHEAQRERAHSSDTAEECTVLKEQLSGLMNARSEAEIEKEILIVNESNEKVKLRELERHVEQISSELENNTKINTELDEKIKKYEAELDSKTEKLTLIHGEKSNLEEEKRSLERSVVKAKQDNEELTTLFNELEAIYNKKKGEFNECNKKLKKGEEELAKLLSSHEEEVAFSKVQLLIADGKISDLSRELEQAETTKPEKAQESWSDKTQALQMRIQELETRCEKSRTAAKKLDSELCQLRSRVSELEQDNESLQRRLKAQRADTSEDGEMVGKLKQVEEELVREKQLAEQRDQEAKNAVDAHHAFLKRYKTLERQNISLQRRLQFATEKLKKNNEKPCNGDEVPSKKPCLDNEVPSKKLCFGNDGESKVSALIDLPSREHVPSLPAPVCHSLLSPLARSMSSLGINTAATSTVTASSTTNMQPVRHSLLPPRPIAKQLGLPTRARPVDGKLNKRTATEPVTDVVSVQKRHRVNSQGDSISRVSAKQDRTNDACGSPEAELPEGLPEVVSKGFNDIPDMPIKSPFILRRTTAQVSKVRQFDKPPIGEPAIRTRSQIARATQKTHIPTVHRTLAKENPSGLRSPPRGSHLLPPKMVLSPRRTNIPRPPGGPSPKKSNIPNIATKRTHQSRTARRTSMGKQGAPATRSSLKQPMRIKPLEGSPTKSSEDQADKCNMQ